MPPTSPPVIPASPARLWPAVAAVGLAYLVPFGSLALYPLALVNTHLHEGAHAVTALLTGGRVEFMHVPPDTSGLTGSRGGIGVLIAFSGYFGTALWGAILLKLSRQHRAPLGLRLVAVVVAAFAVLFGFPSLFTYLTAALIAGGLSWISRKPRIREFAGGVLAVSMILNSLDSITRLWGFTGQSDAYNLAQMTGLPPVIWIVTWLTASLALLGWAFRRSAVRP